MSAQPGSPGRRQLPQVLYAPQGRRVGLKEKVDPNAKYVWFHAASLGEFEQGRPLME